MPAKKKATGKKSGKTKTASKKKVTKRMGKATEPKAEEPKTQEASSPWFRRGLEAFKHKEQLDRLANVRKARMVPRFRLKEGESAKIIFVDSNPFGIQEHSLKLDGRWGNFFTCLKETYGACPICSTYSRPTYTVYFTIIDLRAYTNREGKVIKWTKSLFPAKGTSVLKKLQKLIEKHGGSIAGLAFQVERLSIDDPNCGTEFEYLGKVNIAKKFGPEAAIPHDYDKILAVPTKDELQLLGLSPSVIAGSEDDIDLDDALIDAEETDDNADDDFNIDDSL